MTSIFFLISYIRMSIAKKKNPGLWEKAKREACRSAGLCKHSAREKQWATSYYKRHGGKYIGKKSKSNSLARWSKQKWRTSSGRKSGGKRRYLPNNAWKNLSKSEIRRTNKAKAKGYACGKQYVRQPKDIARKTRRYRTSQSHKRSSKIRHRSKRKTKSSRRIKRRKTKRFRKSSRSRTSRRRPKSKRKTRSGRR